MAIREEHQQVFQAIVHALVNNALVVVECINKQSGKPVTCLCAAVSNKSAMEGATPADLRFLPLAQLFEGDPNDTIAVPKGISLPAALAHGDTKGVN